MGLKLLGILRQTLTPFRIDWLKRVKVTPSSQSNGYLMTDQCRSIKVRPFLPTWADCDFLSFFFGQPEAYGVPGPEIIRAAVVSYAAAAATQDP